MSPRPWPEIRVLPTADEVAQEAARRVELVANASILSADAFTLALSGGSTPRRLYELLANEPYRTKIDWARVEIFFADERCVAPDHPDSNYRMASELLLSKVPIQPQNIHRMRGEVDPQSAAIEYGQMLKTRFGDAGPDMIILGMGEDGHTASLFPGTDAISETHHRCVANYVPKLGRWRITLTAPFINRAAQVLMLVTGASKADVVARALQGPRNPELVPAQLIAPESGTMTWLLDANAADMKE